MRSGRRIDKPIAIARTIIEILLDNSSVTARAKVVLRLSPRPRVVIEYYWPRSEYSQATAYSASNQIDTNPYVDIRIASGITMRTFNGGEQQLGGNDSWCGGLLVPAKQPVTVVNEQARINRCKFVLINFPSLWGAQDIRRPKDGSDTVSTIVQRMQFHADPWLVELTGVDRLMSLDYQMNNLGGSAITHAGSITKTCNSDFVLEELTVVLDALHLFLSFARGSYCGLAFLSGQNSQRRTVWKQWGSRQGEPWQGRLSTWVCSGESEMLSLVFDGFWKRFTNHAMKDTVSQVLRWYLRSNESSDPAVSIILTQAALERLSSAINSQGSGAMGTRIADVLKMTGIDSRIPAECPELITLSRQHSWSHGPHAFVEIRNSLAHSNNRLGSVSADAYDEAQHLGQWYIELMLLHLFDYSGRYYNRLRAKESYTAAVEDVPWSVTRGASP